MINKLKIAFAAIIIIYAFVMVYWFVWALGKAITLPMV